MSEKYPSVTAKECVRVAERVGFTLDRQRGSHAVYYRAEDMARVVIPMHGGTIKRKTLAGIIADLGITVDELRDLLR